MAKVDKSKLSKSEWRKLKEFRRKEKDILKEQKRREDRKKNLAKKSPTQTTPVRDELSSQRNRPIIAEPISVNYSGTAFVLGNGISRKPINPEDLRSLGKIYGCNALYRTFDPDYLVAVDVKMILELQKNAYYKKNKNIWTNPNKSIMKFKGFNFFNPSKGWSSGPTALWLAAQHGYEKIYILGFDYRGLEGGQRFNNIYADTHNYKKSTDAATFFGNWMRQTQNVIREHKDIQFVRVIAPDNYCPEELNKFENFSTIHVEEFQKLFDLPRE